jgi:hypothetical protein
MAHFIEGATKALFLPWRGRLNCSKAYIISLSRSHSIVELQKLEISHFSQLISNPFGEKQEEVSIYKPTKPNITPLSLPRKLVTLGFVGNHGRLGSPESILVVDFLREEVCEGLETTLNSKTSEKWSKEEGEPSWCWEVLRGIPHLDNVMYLPPKKGNTGIQLRLYVFRLFLIDLFTCALVISFIL